MKINTQQELKDLAGKPLTDETGEKAKLGRVISTMLLGAEEGGKMKMFVLAQKFYNDKVVELDSSDFSLVKSIVEKSKAFPNALVTGQVALILENLK